MSATPSRQQQTPRRREPATPSCLRSSSRRHQQSPSPTLDLPTTTPSRRVLTPDLRHSLRRHHTTAFDAPSPAAARQPAAMTPRRTQSMAAMDADPARRPEPFPVTTEGRPWAATDWVSLSRYYEALGRDMTETVRVFYRHESLQIFDSADGIHKIVEVWSKEQIRRYVRCLDIVTKRHSGKPLEERIDAFNAKKRKREEHDQQQQRKQRRRQT